MATTATNKQPLLVDRVFHKAVSAMSLASGSATSLDIEGTNQYHKHMRRKAYTREADPMFFKMQRGEISQADYDSKIAEIRTKYPYST